VLFSSGTTGLLKSIVHGHGGVLLEHLVLNRLHLDLGPADTFFWYTTTNWMMWNVLVSGLLAGSTIVAYDGSPSYPGPGLLWRLLERRDHVGSSIQLNSLSGGTDVIGTFAASAPTTPVWPGELSARCLGVSAAAWDPTGQPLVNQVGELVITYPMPSVPVGFWNDPDGTRYKQAYFDMYPHVWRHGDWVTVSDRAA
jgi:acetoacetyl-CoA synthetase